jgi:hypothetical protein
MFCEAVSTQKSTTLDPHTVFEIRLGLCLDISLLIIAVMPLANKETKLTLYEGNC